MERGKHRYHYVSAPSNTVVKAGPGSLYSITGTWPAGAMARVDDTHRFGQGVLDVNARSSNTIGAFSANTVFVGLGFSTGLAVAVSSNASVTVEME